MPDAYDAIPVLTFFNNKGGVGKTSLAYHLAWRLSQRGQRVLACDLDPQANLTAAFLDEDTLESLWDGTTPDEPRTIFQAIQPLSKVGDLRIPTPEKISPSLSLVPGDLALSGFEDQLSEQWPKAMDDSELYRPFRVLTAFWTVMQGAARSMDATVILADVGPNLGAINRSALIASDWVLVPLGADMFSLQGMRNLGPTLSRWRGQWQSRLKNWNAPDFDLPTGGMLPIGYVVQQHSVRLSRPVKAYEKWANRIPEVYALTLLPETEGPFPSTPDKDPFCLATLKHYRSLVPMAQEARKPIFDLTAADGAIGSHAKAVAEARADFATLADEVMSRISIFF